MKKVLFTLGVLITACNLTIGAAYAALCLGSNGERACGSTCTTNSNGTCTCTGGCSADEIKWVGGAGKGDDEELLF